MPGVNGDGERGALGVAVSPDWPSPATLYVYVTRSTGGGLQEPDREGHALERHVTDARADVPAGELEPVPQRRPDPVRPRRHALRDRRRRPRQLERPGPPGQPPRQDPAHDAERRRARDNPIAGSRVFAFGIRNSFGFTFDPQTGPSVGDRERPRVQRRDQPDRRRRELRLGAERELPGESPGRHEQQRSDAAAAPEALVRRRRSASPGDAFCDGLRPGRGRSRASCSSAT